jgi:hypothetical protein
MPRTGLGPSRMPEYLRKFLTIFMITAVCYMVSGAFWVAFYTSYIAPGWNSPRNIDRWKATVEPARGVISRNPALRMHSSSLNGTSYSSNPCDWFGMEEVICRLVIYNSHTLLQK